MRTEVDGIPAFHAPRAGGHLLAAGLVFRVGRADETLATSGVTHLTEHLALHEHGHSDIHHYNGATADVYTHFHVEGTTEHVVQYLNGVCQALRDLPLGRLEVEKEILRAEAASAHTGPASDAPLYRYGAQGYGLSSYGELGLPRIDKAFVADWARTYFTTENAVLWLAAEVVPDGLDLRLPAGVRQPTPTATSALPITPAWFASPPKIVHLSATIPRSTAANLYTQVLSKALYQDLRQKGGLSYTAAADYQPRDRDIANIVAIADCAPNKQEAVIGGFVDVLARLRVGTIAEAELDLAKAAALSHFDDPDMAVRMLPGRALSELLGDPHLTVADLKGQISATTVADLREVAVQAHQTTLIHVPTLGLDWAGYTRAPEWSDEAIVGKLMNAHDGSSRLIIGDRGVTAIQESGPVTVRFQDVAAMQIFPDGGRRLVSTGGFNVALEPTLYPLSREDLAKIDSAVPAELVVPMDARDAEQIPQPGTKRETPKQPWIRRIPDWAYVVVAVLAFFVLQFFVR